MIMTLQLKDIVQVVNSNLCQALCPNLLQLFVAVLTNGSLGETGVAHQTNSYYSSISKGGNRSPADPSLRICAVHIIQRNSAGVCFNISETTWPTTIKLGTIDHHST